MSDITRTTPQSATMLMMGDLQTSYQNLTKLEQEAATGYKINQPSDNPAGTSEILSLNAQVGRYQQYANNANDGDGWLGAADTTLSQVTTALNQVQTDIEQGANSTATDTTSQAALAQDVLTIKQSLISAASTTYNNRPIFSGTYGTAPYPAASAPGVSDPTSSSYNPATAYAYAGGSTPVTRVVAPGQTLNVSLTADQVFGSGSSSVFALLDKISTDLSSGNSTALSGTDLQQLHSAMNTVVQAHGQVGSLDAAIVQANSNAQSKITTLQSQVATLRDASEDQVISEFDLASTAYQAALATTAKVIQPSLAQFLQ
jgi:flagellar hook-associated protein 3 FlgL